MNSSPNLSPNSGRGAPENKNSRRGKRRGVWFDSARQKWCANGQKPDGRRWRRYDFDDRAAAEEWRRKTIAAASQAADALDRQSVLLAANAAAAAAGRADITIEFKFALPGARDLSGARADVRALTQVVASCRLAITSRSSANAAEREERAARVRFGTSLRSRRYLDRVFRRHQSTATEAQTSSGGDSSAAPA